MLTESQRTVLRRMNEDVRVSALVRSHGIFEDADKEVQRALQHRGMAYLLEESERLHQAAFELVGDKRVSQRDPRLHQEASTSYRRASLRAKQLHCTTLSVSLGYRADQHQSAVVALLQRVPPK